MVTPSLIMILYDLNNSIVLAARLPQIYQNFMVREHCTFWLFQTPSHMALAHEVVSLAEQEHRTTQWDGVCGQLLGLHCSDIYISAGGWRLCNGPWLSARYDAATQNHC